MMEPQAPQPSPPRSKFMTVLSWMLIAYLGFHSFSLAMQNMMTNGLRGETGAGMLARVLLAAFMVAVMGALVTAIGLLKRKNWARLAAIPSIIVYLVGAWVDVFGGDAIMHALWPESPFHMLKELPADTSIDTEFRTQWERTVWMHKAAGVGRAIVFTALGGWLIKRLRSEAVRQEFSAPNAPSRAPDA